MYEVDARGLSCPEPVMAELLMLLKSMEMRQSKCLSVKSTQDRTWKNMRKATGKVFL